MLKDLYGEKKDFLIGGKKKKKKGTPVQDWNHLQRQRMIRTSKIFKPVFVCIANSFLYVFNVIVRP